MSTSALPSLEASPRLDAVFHEGAYTVPTLAPSSAPSPTLLPVPSPVSSPAPSPTLLLAPSLARLPALSAMSPPASLAAPSATPSLTLPPAPLPTQSLTPSSALLPASSDNAAAVEARAHGWEARWLAVCEESAASGRITVAKAVWKRLRRRQRVALKAAADWAELIDIDKEVDWVLPEGALDERDDWRAQWVRVCMEDEMAGTRCTTAAVEDLWFSLRRDQRAALQTMALLMKTQLTKQLTALVRADVVELGRTSGSGAGSSGATSCGGDSNGSRADSSGSGGDGNDDGRDNCGRAWGAGDGAAGAGDGGDGGRGGVPGGGCGGAGAGDGDGTGGRRGGSCGDRAEDNDGVDNAEAGEEEDACEDGVQFDAGIAEISVDNGSSVGTGAGSDSRTAAFDALLGDDVQPEVDIAEVSFDGDSLVCAVSKAEQEGAESSAEDDEVGRMIEPTTGSTMLDHVQDEVEAQQAADLRELWSRFVNHEHGAKALALNQPRWL